MSFMNIRAEKGVLFLWAYTKSQLRVCSKTTWQQAKNALVKYVYYVMNYSICNLV
jgi:hypothetical protein